MRDGQGCSAHIEKKRERDRQIHTNTDTEMLYESSVWGMRVSKCGIKERANLLVCFMKMGEIIIYKIRSGFLSLVFWRIRNSKQ